MDAIETKRLFLDKWNVRKDAKALFAYATDPQVGPNAGWASHVTLKDSKIRIKKLFIPNNTWKITLRDEGVAIGSIGFEKDPRRIDVRGLELGYSLARKYWGKGIMTEAAFAVVDYAFKNTDVEIISITTSPHNERSKRVIEKLGFIYEGCLRYSYRIYDGSVRDTMVYSMTGEEWENVKKQTNKDECRQTP